MPPLNEEMFRPKLPPSPFSSILETEMFGASGKEAQKARRLRSAFVGKLEASLRRGEINPVACPLLADYFSKHVSAEFWLKRVGNFTLDGILRREAPHIIFRAKRATF